MALVVCHSYDYEQECMTIVFLRQDGIEGATFPLSLNGVLSELLPLLCYLLFIYII